MKLLKRKFENFVKWMNYNPPHALNADGWIKFDKEFQENAPYRYFITEKFLPATIYPFRKIKWFLQDVGEFIICRTSKRHHVVNTKLSPGYIDVEERMLYACFSLLVDYVEIECAKNEARSSETSYKKYLGLRRFIPWWIDVFGFRNIRNPKMGMEFLEWELSLGEDSPHQAKKGKVVLELYDWWTQERPKREYPEYPEINEPKGVFGFFSTEWREQNPEEYKKFEKWCDEVNYLEEKWQNEDQEMLNKLVDIRPSLWT